MKSYVSNAEINELGEALVKQYYKKKGQPIPDCVDIEGFLIEFLGLSVVYEDIKEDDPDYVAFCSNGTDTLKVRDKNGGIIEKVFPKNTIVLDRMFLRVDASGSRRFALGHECGHFLMNRHCPMAESSYFMSVFDRERNYSFDELKARCQLVESQADRMSAALLMPRCVLDRVLQRFHDGKPFPLYGSSILCTEDKITIQNMADVIGVSFQALFYRLRGFKLFELHDLSEYIEKNLNLGGNADAD